MKRAASLVLLSLALLAAGCVWAVRGSYAVGYRDGVWYPAAGGGERMRLRDFIPRLEDWDMKLQAIGFSDEEIVELFDREMQARAGATELPSVPFPRRRIRLAAGEVAADYAIVAELVASHGYVVSINDISNAELIIPRGVHTLDFHRNPAAARRAASRLFDK